MDIILHSTNDETYINVETSNSIGLELSEFFSFFVPGHEFSPKFKRKQWDGKIRLYDRRYNRIYKGMLHHLYKFANDRGYSIDKSFKIKKGIPDLSGVLERINLPEDRQPRPYQIKGYDECVKRHRALVLSPTASGKSLLIYLLARHYETKTLIIVPTINLTLQMRDDFRSYNYDGDIQIIDGKADKSQWHGVIGSDVVITTWQSIYKMPKSWFDQFTLVMGDEAHLFKASSLQATMKKMAKVKYRFAFTGTLDGMETHKLAIESHFGEVFPLITTKELIDSGYATPLKIEILVLKHENITLTDNEYIKEKEYLVTHEKRNRLIKNLALKTKSNTLILFEWVDKHGKVLYDIIRNASKRKVFFISGETDGQQREEIRRILSNENDAILVASYGTLSTGANIPNLHNIIFASPSKGRIRNLQSIGRGLRLHSSKSHVTLYDIADDLRKTKSSKTNYTMNHLYERVKIYNDEKFDYRITRIRL